MRRFLIVSAMLIAGPVVVAEPPHGTGKPSRLALSVRVRVLGAAAIIDPEIAAEAGLTTRQRAHALAAVHAEGRRLDARLAGMRFEAEAAESDYVRQFWARNAVLRSIPTAAQSDLIDALSRGR